MASATAPSSSISTQLENLGKSAVDNPIAAAIVIGALVLVLK